MLKQPAYAAAAWTTIGFMELAADQLPQALTSARNGHAAEPASPFPALLAVELVERGQTGAETGGQKPAQGQPARHRRHQHGGDGLCAPAV